MTEMKIPDWKLERFLLKELPPRQMSEIEARLSTEPDLRRRLKDLEESNRVLLEEYPAEMMNQRILSGYRERAEVRGAGEKTSRTARRRILMSGLALTTAAVMFFLVRPPDLGHRHGVMDSAIPDKDVPDIIRIKGMKPGLYIYRKNAGGVEELRDGSAAKFNDLLQLAYVSTGDAYGIILSIDGRGVVTRHFPSAGGKSARFETNKKVLLPSAYQLDDAPEFERFFLVSSGLPLDVRKIMQAAENLAKDPAHAKTGLLQSGKDTRQISILIRKSAQP